MENMLELIDLSVEINNKRIIDHINLQIPVGETYILFGPNGTGKSSLMYAILGYPKYKITSGRIIFKGIDITNKSIFERTALGMGLAFQTPPSIKGVKLGELINRLAGKNNIDSDIIDKIKQLKMESFLHRDINTGFSGGEKKRSELLQLIAQNPDLILLDEPESGVDIENMKIIGEVIKNLLERYNNKNRKKSGLIITHTGYILDYVAADKGIVLLDGKIKCSSNPYELLHLIEKEGFTKCMHCDK